MEIMKPALSDSKRILVSLNIAGWIPSRRGVQSVVWSDDDRQGIQGWLNTNQIQADIEQCGFTCTRMTWLDRNVNKLLELRAGDAIAVVYDGNVEYAILNKLAIVRFSDGAKKFSAFLWKPQWYELLNRSHKIRETFLLQLKDEHGADWLSVADVETAVMLVHSCSVKCLDSCCANQKNEYELFDGDVGVKLDMPLE
jgi:hypothetical protein